MMTKTMKAAVLHALKTPLVIEQVPDAELPTTPERVETLVDASQPVAHVRGFDQRCDRDDRDNNQQKSNER